MIKRPVRWIVGSVLAVVFLGVLSVTSVSAMEQVNHGVSPLPNIETIWHMLWTLVFGGWLIVAYPEYTERNTQFIRENPLATFGTGLVALIGLFIILFLLILTVIGVLFALPLAILAGIVAELGFLTVGRLFSDDWGVVLLIAVVVAGVLSLIPVIGSLLLFCIGACGVGTAVSDYVL
ncbi:hypothetical protein [Natronosalvus vescus]|uniref:hypothetical protein n=1 Tax=Natronosalvus vescus TaxID=2953881 RepID=UPI00209195FF|nr:hypothetical protein [Natronosalvus vescus]